MEQSILKNIKKLVGIADDDTSFDLDIITHINTSFSHLHQLGVGPAQGFVIEDDAPTWDDAFPDMPLELLSAVKNNMQLHVRQLFDPPQQWHLMNSLNQMVLESDVRVSMIRENAEWTPAVPPVVIDGGDPAAEGDDFYYMPGQYEYDGF